MFNRFIEIGHLTRGQGLKGKLQNSLSDGLDLSAEIICTFSRAALLNWVAPLLPWMGKELLDI